MSGPSMKWDMTNLTPSKNISIITATTQEGIRNRRGSCWHKALKMIIEKEIGLSHEELWYAMPCLSWSSGRPSVCHHKQADE